MLDALHRDAWPQHIAEHLQFRATKSLTGRRGGTDRAVILQQHEALRVDAPLGHVAFARTQPRQPLDARAQRRGVGQRCAIEAPGLLLAHSDQLLQRRFAESGAHRVDQADGQLGVGVGKAAVRRRSQMPNARRPPDAVPFNDRRNQTLAGEPGELLAYCLCRGAECGGNVGGAERAAPFQQAKDAVAGAILQAHAWILHPARQLRKLVLG